MMTSRAPTFELDSIHQGDCIEYLNKMPPRCVDLIFADPPYNLQLKQDLFRPNLSQVDAVDDEWDQFAGFAEYDLFTRSWLKACRRVLKNNGAIWVIGSYHNIFRVGNALQDLGYWILNDVVWVKSNPMPNFRGVRFCNAHETLIWAKKSEKQSAYTFNYKSLKAGNEDLQVRSDWRFPICGGLERLRDETGKVHSTQKPVGLLHRIIRACSNTGDVVLDPFFGSGTTGAVAKQLGRHYIGIERQASYVAAARARIADISTVADEFLDRAFEQPSRIPFVSLIELGLLAAGAALRLKRTAESAKVNVDGTVTSNGFQGSIHSVGAKLLGTHGCNGWEHWLYESAAGELKPIDELRKEARVRLGLA
jgi:modification methylase